jgi:pyridoxine 5-phosphate synthase
VELYTHHYAGVRDPKARGEAFKKLAKAAEEGHKLGLEIHGGHGLNYTNVSRVARLPWMTELSIGHAIIARAVFVGLRQAVQEMAELMKAS